MKKVIAVFLAIFMVVGMTACGGIKNDKFYNEKDSIQVVDGVELTLEELGL